MIAVLLLAAVGIVLADVPDAVTIGVSPVIAGDRADESSTLPAQRSRGPPTPWCVRPADGCNPRPVRSKPVPARTK